MSGNGLNVDERAARLSVDLVESSCRHQGGEDTLRWLADLRRHSTCHVHLTRLRGLDRWHFDAHSNLRHESGRFFSIEGLHVRTGDGPVPEWSQPIINQPEIGILGILCQKRDGVLQFLLQAKTEPGNVDYVQLSPTTQATRSNYTRVHGGRTPAFLEYFDTPPRDWILFDQLQSEQGGRFYKKRNRNMLLVVPPDVALDVPERFRWLPLGQIKSLIRRNNVINMDSRTVLACLSLAPGCERRVADLLSASSPAEAWRLGLYESLLSHELGLHSIEVILSHLTSLKARSRLDVRLCGVDELSRWQVREFDIAHEEDRFFTVVGADIAIEDREVRAWAQPLVRPRHEGLVGFVLRRIQGTVHLLVQAKMEPGNFDILELAPTVQCITGNYLQPSYDIPYIDLFQTPAPGSVLVDTLQSEEGGRFYQEQNRYMVVEVGEEFPVEVDERYIWMTLGQAKLFIKFNNYFNVEARSLIGCFSPV